MSTSEFQIPDRWVLVPMVPTAAMVRAYDDACAISASDGLRLEPYKAMLAAAPAVVVDEAMIDAALFCTPRGGSMDEDLAMPIDFMGLGQPEKLPLARQVMGAALAAALKVSP